MTSVEFDLDFSAGAGTGGRDSMSGAERRFAIFVDRTTKQWVVSDPEGVFWTIPSDSCSWALRQPFQPDEASDLQMIPLHYRSLLRLPF